LRQSYFGGPQFGGSCKITINRTCYKIITSGLNEQRMRRWSWSLLNGRNSLRLRILTLYIPVKSFGAASTYQQQQQLLHESDIAACPRTQSMTDLRLLLQLWTTVGDKVIVMGYLNEDVRNTNIIVSFATCVGSRRLTIHHRS
jgi:hypothetical protein